MLLALLLSTQLVFADNGLPRPGDPDDPTSPTGGVALDYRQEGMYAIQTTCAGVCNTDLAKQLSRLSVVDSHSMLGVWVTLGSTSPGTVIDGFYAAVVNPDATTITAEPRSGSHTGHFSYVNFRIDPVTGTLDGTAYDFQSPGHYVIHGTPLIRVADLLKGPLQAGMSSDKMVATFHGSLNGVSGTLNVTKTPDGRLFGFFGSDTQDLGQPDFQISFSGGAWNSQVGMLQLVFENPRFFAEGELAFVVLPDGTLRAMYVDGFVESVSAFVRTS